MTAPVTTPRPSPSDARDRLREAGEPTDAELLAEIAAEEAVRKAALPRAVKPIPVRGRFYLMQCEHCDWVGSSELCGTDHGPWGDSDVYCPACDESTLANAPNEADEAKFGQAVFDRIANLEADLATERTAKEAERNTREQWVTQAHEFAAAADRFAREKDATEADRDRLAERVAALEAALDQSWRKVIGYPFGQVCKHLIASNMLSDMEELGFEIPSEVAAAVVKARDEAALAAPPLVIRRALDTAIGGTNDDAA